jgi:2-polyprenyl-3-methyl-5-hydroxy-6-metoxy-1,4-benzoquinol methylase
MSRFDKVAADWDKNKMHIDRSEAIARELQPVFARKNYYSALEYGAGTGLLSFLLLDYFKEIVLMDSSIEMVNTTNTKIAESGRSHIKALVFDLEHQDFEEQKFDVIFTQMVLHHVADVDLIFEKFQKMLNPKGMLAIADLFTEDGSFHGSDFDGHHGFDPDRLAHQLTIKGFEKISNKECFIIKKEIQDGITKEFPVFLLIAFKR